MKKGLHSQKGFIVVDFIFAFILVGGFFVAILALTITLTMTELTQYLTFASARSFMAGHTTVQKQKQMGTDKFKALTTHRVFGAMYSNGWFQVDDEPFVGNHSNGPDPVRYDPLGDDPYGFTGTSTSFTASILKFSVPLYGSSTGGDDSGAFVTHIGSYLGREPSQSECQNNFNQNRWTRIRANHSAASNQTTSGGYFPISDNGC